MSVVDIFILVVLAFFLLKGIWRGLLKEICSLLGLVLGGIFAFVFYLPVAQRLQDSFGAPAQLSVWGSFLLIFLLVYLLFAVVGWLLHRFVKAVFLGGLNRIAGAFFGLLQAVVLLSVLLLALSSSVVPERIQQLTRSAQLAPPFVALGQSLLQGGQDLLER